MGGGFFKRNKPLQYHTELSMLNKSSFSFSSDEKFYDKKMRDEFESFMVFRDPRKMIETV